MRSGYRDIISVGMPTMHVHFAFKLICLLCSCRVKALYPLQNPQAGEDQLEFKPVSQHGAISTGLQSRSYY